MLLRWLGRSRKKLRLMFGCGSRRIKKNTADLSLSCESTLALLAPRDVIALVNSEGEYPRKEGHLVIGFKKVSATIFWASTMTEPRLPVLRQSSFNPLSG